MWQAFFDLGTDLAQNNRFLYGIMVVATMTFMGLTLGLLWEGIFSLLKLRPRKDSPREGPGEAPTP